MLVLLARLKLHIRALNHFLEDLNLAQLLLQLRLILLFVLFSCLLMPLFQYTLLGCQLLIPADQFSNVFQTFFQLLRHILVFLGQRSNCFSISRTLGLK